MFRAGFLFICLLVASLAATTTVHARELPGAVALECSGAVHVERDDYGKPASGDADKGALHHHGCHSASTFLPASIAVDVMVVRPARAYPALRVAALPPRQSGPGLRPPIA